MFIMIAVILNTGTGPWQYNHRELLNTLGMSSNIISFKELFNPIYTKQSGS